MMEIEKKCILCGDTRKVGSRGLCRACYMREWRTGNLAALNPDRKCVECGEVKKIRAKGLCDQCYNRHWRLARKGQVRNRPLEHCVVCGKRLSCSNYEGLCYLCKGSPRKPTKTGKIGKCRMCGKAFELVKGQHSTLHWCPECQNLKEYKEFGSNQWFSRTTVNRYGEVKRSEIAMY